MLFKRIFISSCSGLNPGPEAIKYGPHTLKERSWYLQATGLNSFLNSEWTYLGEMLCLDLMAGIVQIFLSDLWMFL